MHCSRHNRESLMKVTSKQDSDSSKRFVCFIEQISQEAINRSHSMFMLHWHFIPDDDFCLPQDIIHERISLYPSYRRVCDGDWNFKSGMSCSSTLKQERSNSR